MSFLKVLVEIILVLSGQDPDDLPEDIVVAKKVFKKPAAKEARKEKGDSTQKAKAIEAARERIIKIRSQKMEQRKREEDNNPDDDDFVEVRKEKKMKQRKEAVHLQKSQKCNF